MPEGLWVKCLACKEMPDGWTLTGGAVIIASVTYIAHREARATGESST